MKRFLLFLLLPWLVACVHVPSPAQRGDSARALAAQAGWGQEFIVTDDFTLLAYLPATFGGAQTLTLYIEGDGLAWISSSMPSSNPTPVNPLALKLALRDDTPAAYIARPCQYTGTEQWHNCAQRYWTSHRFSPEVIHATSQAIDQIKQRFGAEKLILVGYSGGGAVAALVAAGRQDVTRLITIGTSLDHRAWTAEYRLSALSGSLNPADAWQQLQHVAQTHYIGGNDKMVGEGSARAYAAHFKPGLQPSIIVIPGFDHHCCWVDHWPALKDAEPHQ